MWATRGSRELLRWPYSLFITLTYDDQHLPQNGSLNKKDIQDFIKRVKKRLGSSKENPIRQIYCGEYGSRTSRPHYHVILFNAFFDDLKGWRKSDQGHQIFTSKLLDSLWGLGHAEFGIAQPGSIAYLFKYVLKKKSRKEKEQPLYIERDGVTFEVAHEFIEASRNPGIGAHIRGSDSLKKGYLTLDGVKKKLPKYYKEHMKKHDPFLHEEISDRNFEHARTRAPESPLRKKQKEQAQKKLTDTKKKL